MEFFALQSMETHPSSAELVERKKVLSSLTIFMSSREPFMFSSDILCPSVAEAIGILSPSVAWPRLTEEVVESNKVVTQHQWEDAIPKMKFGERLDIAPYRNHQLVQPHFPTSTSIQHVSHSKVQEFYRRHGTEKNFTVVIIAFQLDGWHSSVPIYVLQLFLVGNILFSASEPSKVGYTSVL